ACRDFWTAYRGIIGDIETGNTLHASVPPDRSRGVTNRPHIRALVRTHVSGGLCPGLAAWPPAHQAGQNRFGRTRPRRPDLLLRAGGRGGRAAGLCAVLQAGRLPRPSA